MNDANELQAAVERLRRVKAGEHICAVYDARFRFAEVELNADYQTLADAYLELGNTMPVEAEQQSQLTFDQLSDMADIVNTDKWDELPTEVPNAD